MKTVNATRRSKAQNEYVLRPSRWRMTLIYTILFALAVMVGLVIRMVFGGGFNWDYVLGDWYVNLAIVVIGAVMFAQIDYGRWTMRVQDGKQVEGPSGALGERNALLLKDINWERSGKSLRSRIKVGTAIYTHAGHRILISPWFYDPETFQEFLGKIGYR